MTKVISSTVFTEETLSDTSKKKGRRRPHDYSNHNNVKRHKAKERERIKAKCNQSQKKEAAGIISAGQSEMNPDLMSNN